MCYSVGSVCILSIACMIVSSYSVGSVCILSIACTIVLSSPAGYNIAELGLCYTGAGMELDGALEHTWNWMEHTANGLSLHQ